MFPVSVEYAELHRRQDELRELMTANRNDRLLGLYRPMPRFACQLCLALGDVLIHWGFDLKNKVLLNNEHRSLSYS